MYNIPVTFIYIVLNTHMQPLGCVMASDIIQANIFWNMMYPEYRTIISIPLHMHKGE